MMYHDHLVSLVSPPVTESAAKRATQREAKKRANATMPDNKGVGWRKKIHSKPKELPPLKVGADDTTVAEDPSDRRRHGWRKTIQGSRPTTPATLTAEEAEETRGEHAESATTRRNSKPKLIRYTSLFSSFKEAPKGPNFAEPWSNVKPPIESYIDPMVVIQSVRSHMVSFSMTPIPLEHNNGLFCIFEDYHKLRNKNGHLEAVLQDTRLNLESAGNRWTKEERRYAEEIRRLELMIARGATGVAGVLRARHGSVVDRKRIHRKTISSDRMSTWYGFLTQEQIDTEIRLRSQNVLLQRSASPSGKMAALSRQFTGKVGTDLPVGTPPKEDRIPTLSRKVQSELDLSKLARMDIAQSVALSSLNSGFSGDAGDPLPDEISTPSPVYVEMALECDAFVALRELGTLVARRRGMNTENFIESLIMLFSEADKSDSYIGKLEQPRLAEDTSSFQRSYADGTTSLRTLRRFQSQPQLSSDQKRRRNFSFEPGEDHLQALKEELTMKGTAQSYGEPSMSNPPISAVISRTDIGSSSGGSISPYQVLSCDHHNLSKIPTPVHPFGSVRRETSVSSLQSILTRSKDGRHKSQTSILTAFLDNQNGTLRPTSSSRSSSFNTLRGPEVSPASHDPPGSIRIRNSVASLAAARATDQANITAMSKGGSPVRSNPKSYKTGSASRAAGNSGPYKPENDNPQKSGVRASQ